MPQFLRIAEKVYRNLQEKKDTNNDPIENLNTLIIEIRKEIKGTKLKLLYNFIDFEECLNKPNQECKVQLDISLIPKIKNEDEFILWLAGFIERITTDGKRKAPPPLRSDIPPEFQFNATQKKDKPLLNIREYSKSVEQIDTYFKSEEYTTGLNKEQ
ncbi:hypothetical protein EXE30_03410 [Acinetobacter halotolerans]|uniref:Uncharacterized protein n=1 Tax=Acinetobacter halotolerans TaxID=1752076 RepID=A0A4Q6XMD8_9GAMM|nr:hypothetical protein [Acinetobacter halotolerans]RZF55867.1 hypothetical protein EXE30_03410 [Acinetobacter halotolerans]